jgi:ABC-type phosphate/phosphonate transport system permease subunit
MMSFGADHRDGGGRNVACVLVGMVAGLWLGAGVPGHRWIYWALASVRSIRDLTLGILYVVVVGIGPAVGMLVLAVFYSAAIGKCFFKPVDVALDDRIGRRRSSSARPVGRSQRMRATLAS